MTTWRDPSYHDRPHLKDEGWSDDYPDDDVLLFGFIVGIAIGVIVTLLLVKLSVG